MLSSYTCILILFKQVEVDMKFFESNIRNVSLDILLQLLLCMGICFVHFIVKSTPF